MKHPVTVFENALVAGRVATRLDSVESRMKRDDGEAKRFKSLLQGLFRLRDLKKVED